jgi:hypothetical protein
MEANRFCHIARELLDKIPFQDRFMVRRRQCGPLQAAGPKILFGITDHWAKVYTWQIVAQVEIYCLATSTCVQQCDVPFFLLTAEQDSVELFFGRCLPSELQMPNHATNRRSSENETVRQRKLLCM